MTPPSSTRSLPATAAPCVPLLPYQQEDVDAPDRFRWNCWSRQTGKSFTKSLRRILRGLRRRRNQIFLSAGERQSRELMRKARQHCQTLKIACDYYDDRTFAGTRFRQLEIVLPGGVRIIGLPANPDTARGFTGDVFLDEFAMHQDDRAIWASIFPSLMRGGGELDVASTPKGQSNMFYELRTNDRFARSTITLPDAIAQGLDVDAAAIREAMGDEELYRQEFLCEFLDEATAFLTYERIRACEDDDEVRGLPRTGLQPACSGCGTGLQPVSSEGGTTPRPVTQKNHRLQAGATQTRGATCSGGATHGLIARTEPHIRTLLPSIARSPRDLYLGMDIGRRRDLTVIWILERHGELLRTAAVLELASAPFDRQYALLAELLCIRRMRRAAIDAGGVGMQLAETALAAFGPHRIDAVTFTAAAKSQMAVALRVLVEQQRIRIPADERIRNDWHSVRRAVSATGHFLLSAGRGSDGHADRFWAAALAVRAAGEATGALEWTVSDATPFHRNGTW